MRESGYPAFTFGSGMFFLGLPDFMATGNIIQIKAANPSFI
jgi:hypothetical protein